MGLAQARPNEVIHQSKKRKLDTNTDEITESPCSIEMWVILNNFKLSSTDKKVILAGNELTDMHINFCQAILKKQFPKLVGLHSTLLLHRCTIDKPYALQILHCRGNHWCVVTSISCPSGQVMVYDSLYESIDQETSSLLLNVFGASIVITAGIGPKQTGVKDCGLFAVAIATLLASGGDSSYTTFNQQAMREHLIYCIEHLHFTPFPVLN